MRWIGIALLASGLVCLGAVDHASAYVHEPSVEDVGESLVGQSDRGMPAGGMFPNHDPDYVITNLTNNQYQNDEAFPNGYYFLYPSFNADGTRIACTARHREGGVMQPYEIWVMDYDPTTQLISNFQMVTTTGGVGDVAWNHYSVWSRTDPDLLLFVEVHLATANVLRSYDHSTSTFTTVYDPSLDSNGYDVVDPGFLGTDDTKFVIGAGHAAGQDKILVFDGAYPSTIISSTDQSLVPCSNYGGDRVTYQSGYAFYPPPAGSIYSEESGGVWTEDIYGFGDPSAGDVPGYRAFYNGKSDDAIFSLRLDLGWSSTGLGLYQSDGTFVSDLLGDGGTDFKQAFPHHNWEGPSGETLFRAEEFTHSGNGNNLFVARARPTTVWVDDDWTGPTDCGGHAWGYDAYATIQEALDVIGDGGTIHVAAGIYDEFVLFERGLTDVTVSGNVDAFGLASTDPALSVMTEGLRFVNTAPINGLTLENLYLQGNESVNRIMTTHAGQMAVNDFTLRNCVLDGENVTDRFGIFMDAGAGRQGFGGDFTIERVEFKDILGWAVIHMYYGTPVTVLDSVTFVSNWTHECNGVMVLMGHPTTLTASVTVSNNIWENLGWNQGQQGNQYVAVEINRAEVLTMQENIIDNVALGAWGNGQAAKLWDIGTVDISHNSFSDNHEGIYIWGKTGTYAIPSGSISYNSFTGNNLYGISVDPTATGGPLNAEMNWWGDASGPSTSDGTGDAALGDIDYDPWIGKPTEGVNILCDPDSEELTASAPTTTIDVNYMGGGGGAVFGYSVELTWSGAIASTDPTKVAQGSLLSDEGSTFFDARTTGTDEITIDCFLLGTERGALTPGTMFSVEFAGQGFGTTAVDVTVLKFRNAGNDTLYGFYEDDGELIVDVDVPVITNVKIENATLTHTDAFIKHHDVAEVTATVTDDDPSFAKADIKADLSGLGGGTEVEPDTYSSDVATWTTMLTDVTCVPPDGEVTVVVTGTDPMGNEGTAQDTITADNTAPTAATDFDAAPGHKKCDLTWTNGTDTYLSGVAVRRDTIGAEYPLYMTFVGAWPAVDDYYPTDEADGVEAYNGAGTSGTDNVIQRNIYFYQAFCYDIARNYGPAASTARDLATSYWLGDVSDGWGTWGYDGLLDDNDFLKLSGTYGATSFTGNDAECDVGPTVHPPGHRHGLPTPDTSVDFEDLMIFAMNYGTVSPRVLPLLPDVSGGALALVLAEAGDRSGETLDLVLRLEGNSTEVKGLSALVLYDASRLEFVSARLSESMSTALGDLFFWHGAEDGEVMVDLAALGTGVTIGGSGDVAVLTFRHAGSGDVRVELEDARLRGAENEDLETELTGYVAAHGEGLPTEFKLVQNAPNPFNPITNIAYHVPERSRVTIRVYNASGQLVRTLVDGDVEAGRYSAVWDGRNDAREDVVSGVYFCTMDAFEFHGSNKMLLLK